jgi:cytoskeletal protein RodZ
MDDDKKTPLPTNPGDAETPAPMVEVEASFGTWLKGERTKRRVNLEEIAAVTKVHIMQLKALEEDQVAKLPAPAFVRGFLVSYARHLGLDENEVLERYKKGHSSSLTPIADLLMPQTQRAAKSASAPKVRIVSSPHITQAPGVKEVERPSPSMLNFRVLMIGAGFFGLLILIGALIALGKKQKPSTEASKVEVTAATPEVTAPPPALPLEKTEAAAVAPKVVDKAKAPVAAVDPDKKATAQTATIPTTLLAEGSPKKYKFEVRAIEQNWLSVRIDDGSSKGFLLKAGALQPFEADKRVTLSLSDAGNIEVKWDGVWYGAPGSRGDVKTLVLPDQIETLTKKVALPPRPKPVAPVVPPDANAELKLDPPAPPASAGED